MLLSEALEEYKEELFKTTVVPTTNQLQIQLPIEQLKAEMQLKLKAAMVKVLKWEEKTGLKLREMELKQSEIQANSICHGLDVQKQTLSPNREFNVSKHVPIVPSIH